MSIELKVPALGESITEVEIGEWLKPEGATVAKDENVVALESDKATVELPAPAAGRIAKILKQKGERAAIGEVIAQMEPVEKVEAPPPTEGQGNGHDESNAPKIAPKREITPPKLEPPKVTSPQTGGEPSKPSASHAVHEAPTEQEKTEPEVAVSEPPTEGKDEVVRMSPLRRAVARRLVEAQRNAALLTTFNELDMSAVMGLRKEFQAAFQEKHGVKLGLMSFFVKAVVDALKLVPQVNAEVRGTDIVYHHHYDIAVAVGGGKGLVTPVLRGAERMSFAEIELAISDLAGRAKDNKLKPEELEGGTFTISNGGVYGSMLSTPIVNPPQSGILGLHAIQDRPVAREGSVVIRPMMYAALTYDHRIVDGREAVTFLKRVKEVVETPARMLLEV